MGASYLKSHTGIPIDQLENNVSYIQHWLGHLKNDKKFIVYASSQAQKATDYILNIKNEEREVEMEKKDEVKNFSELKEIREMKNSNEKSGIEI